MACEIARHFLVEELQVPSVHALALLRMRRAVFQFWITNAPSAVTQDLALFSVLEVRVYRVLRLVVPVGVPELFEFEVVERARELLLDAHL